MSTSEIINFLRKLNTHNNREWFTANKARYEKVREEFISFLDRLIHEIARFDSSVSHLEGKKCAFRIYRDVRFSHDKSPYKTHFGAMIMANTSKTEIHNKAGYYIHIEPGKSMLAGGAYMPPSPWLKAIRREIAFNTDEFRKIISHKDFKNNFGEMEGEKLQRPPQGFDSGHPAIELLKMKSFLAVHYMDDKTLLDIGLVKHASAVFKAMYPFNAFLNRTDGQ
jgi:uncharacterized protein (TIGR02453 family)